MLSAKLNIHIFFMIFPYCCALPDFNEPFYENENGREMKKKNDQPRKRKRWKSICMEYVNESWPVPWLLLTNNMLKWHMYSIFNSFNITSASLLPTLVGTFACVCAIQSNKFNDRATKFFRPKPEIDLNKNALF